MNLSDFVHIVFDWLQILSGECSYYKCCILNIPANFNFDLAQYLENRDTLACQQNKKHFAISREVPRYGDYRDRTGDLLHAMQALSRPPWNAPPEKRV